MLPSPPPSQLRTIGDGSQEAGVGDDDEPQERSGRRRFGAYDRKNPNPCRGPNARSRRHKATTA